MPINAADLTGKMLDAAKVVVGQKWPTTRQYFESEAKMLAERLASIATLRAEGVISEERAKGHLDFQKDAWETVLLAVAGLNQLMVEEALNAALNAVKDVINTAVGFALI